ncbi:hypothetical protein BOW52_07655 [Solemya elarraichensis gill symbiont]|uniref:protein O-GlcNAc transferase n=2 Tax=Solemya elarraichensis gill symbiont TaxID=1918949 RepID=A0A1T2L1W6_9GAMM|nr:hypothetical protein BOW52_07655 [Solemya elarraichensis gill symbiont]
MEKGLAYAGKGNYKQALKLFDKVLAKEPGNASAWYNKALTLKFLNRIPQSLDAFDKSLALAPNDVETWFAKGVALAENDQHKAALTCYFRALEVRPDFNQVWMNIGMAYSDLGNHEDALQWYDKDLGVRPRDAEVYLNKALSLEQLQRNEEAAGCCETALSIMPSDADVLVKCAHFYQKKGALEDALQCIETAMRIDPDQVGLQVGYLLTKMRMSDWSGFNQLLGTLLPMVKRHESFIAPFALMELVDEPEMQRQVAQAESQAFKLGKFDMEVSRSIQEGGKICIGYYSADLREHPMAHLLEEVISLHDRTRFEVVAFSFRSGNDGDPMRLRLEKSFDRFIDVMNLSDEDIVTMSREIGVDIAINLGGYTAYTRNQVFAYGVAPVQVNYLGFPGTMAADFMDYIIADKTVVTQKTRREVSESVVYMPDTYFPPSRLYEVSSEPLDRIEEGLPESGFVFCCFNRNEKILPAVFSSWMRILDAVPDSVLWLYTGKNRGTAERNLRKEAERMGVDGARIVFARRVGHAEHLARHRLADLFLDTLPYNAHTTATDALWMNLPVLTHIGKAFHARVAASLLHAIELPELVVVTTEEYETRAIELATSSDKLQAIRDKLAANRDESALFNTERYTSNLDKAYLEMIECHRRGEKPTDIVVES